MAFTEVQELDCETTTALGGKNRTTGKNNPTRIEGYYIGSKEVESRKSKNGKAKLHIIQTADGRLGVWGKTDMDRKLLSVTPGAMTRITHTGMQATPNGEMYKYKVEQDTSNTLEGFQAPVQHEASTYQGSDESDVDLEEAEPLDEVAYVAPRPPARPSVPSAANQAKVQAFLQGRNKA